MRGLVCSAYLVYLTIDPLHCLPLSFVCFFFFLNRCLLGSVGVFDTPYVDGTKEEAEQQRVAGISAASLKPGGTIKLDEEVMDYRRGKPFYFISPDCRRVGRDGCFVDQRKCFSCVCR